MNFEVGEIYQLNMQKLLDTIEITDTNQLSLVKLNQQNKHAGRIKYSKVNQNIFLYLGICSPYESYPGGRKFLFGKDVVFFGEKLATMFFEEYNDKTFPGI